MISEDTKNALKEMRENLEEEARQEAREKGKAYGRFLDQTEICYKQYVPPQIANHGS